MCLFRLWVRLGDHLRLWQSADAYFDQHGAHADDPVKMEVVRLIAQVQWAMATVRREYESLPPPYRPGVNPYQTSGLSARLKADFQARGITEVQRDRPRLPD